MTSWLPYACVASAFGAAVLFSTSGDEVVKHLLVSAFAPLVGLALAFWGVEEVRAGELRGKRR